MFASDFKNLFAVHYNMVLNGCKTKGKNTDNSVILQEQEFKRVKLCMMFCAFWQPLSCFQ